MTCRDFRTRRDFWTRRDFRTRATPRRDASSRDFRRFSLAHRNRVFFKRARFTKTFALYKNPRTASWTTRTTSTRATTTRICPSGSWKMSANSGARPRCTTPRTSPRRTSASPPWTRARSRRWRRRSSARRSARRRRCRRHANARPPSWSRTTCPTSPRLGKSKRSTPRRRRRRAGSAAKSSTWWRESSTRATPVAPRWTSACSPTPGGRSARSRRRGA